MVENLLKAEVVVAVLCFLVMLCSHGFLDYVFIGGAKPQIFSTVQLLLSIAGYLILIKYYLSQQAYLDSIVGLNTAFQNGCYKPDSSTFAADINSLIDSSTRDVELGLAPLLIQGILLIIHCLLMF